MEIHFHTFRHGKATSEYNKTKDILHVVDILGHKSIQNTLIYTHLTNFKDDEFVTKVAKTTEEAAKLIENGFEFVLTTRKSYAIQKKEAARGRGFA